ncbi:MAG: hypothetical protein OXC44_08250 [Proteobacteria bacterium]|nr:hypothetical protein [Pseudomonadota bacterium]
MSAVPFNTLRDKSFLKNSHLDQHDHIHNSHNAGDHLEHKEHLEETLQKFAMEVGIICALENGNKIPPKEAYHQIKALFRTLKVAKRAAYPKKHKTTTTQTHSTDQ